MGNLRSVQKGLEKAGAKAVVTSDPKQIDAADGVVLPGVGAFGRCMENLEKYNLVEMVKQVATGGKPFLGICLGLQLLFEESEEFGPVKGLGILPGKVVRFPESAELSVPHMGWNQIQKSGEPQILNGIDDKEWFYFVHSYHIVAHQPEDILTTTHYGHDFVSAIQWENILGVQFHPEKSHKFGMKLLKNFAGISINA